MSIEEKNASRNVDNGNFDENEAMYKNMYLCNRIVTSRNIAEDAGLCINVA